MDATEIFLLMDELVAVQMYGVGYAIALFAQCVWTSIPRRLDLDHPGKNRTISWNANLRNLEPPCEESCAFLVFRIRSSAEKKVPAILAHCQRK